MSLEAFKLKYPTEPSIRRMIEGIRADRNRRRSLVGVLAEELTSEGASGFKELTRVLQSSSNETVVPDMGLMNTLPPPVKTESFKNLAAVVFGLSVVGLEDAMMDFQFNSSEWAARYNLAMSGSFVPKMEVVGVDVEEIPDQKWRAMIDLAGKDKTLAIFFKDMRAMPKTLKVILEKANFDVLIQESISSVFKERACFLLG